MNNIFVLSLYNSNQLCLIDTEEVDRIIKFKWSLNKNGYIFITNDLRCYLHQFILKYYNNGKAIDHKNNLRWDNRKINLQKIGHGTNGHKGNKRKNSISKFRGVYFIKNRNKYRFEITKDGKRYSKSDFSSEQEAVLAFNRKAKELYGDNAFQNEIK